ncbi:U-box domain-containing protein 19-like [Macadamia integrifolia]|uniref:U-box domain-containing protein 19-like n=1 Tax=Macadamia integrifolia TaxID=60698 RepID=UPI001C4F550D|nr:U-box domain-containing protein 19-like [Macadamia integrifolia]
MIQNSDDTNRRILRFPAVHPCQSVSPRTLLLDLISLSRNICDYKSKVFATQKRNAREAIRQIRILLIFFEEIRDRHDSALPDSVRLCFSELHLTLQKLRFLLEDCTREGARVWILMKCERVSTEFRVLIRTIATALDVLPLCSIDVSSEVRELVELVANQAFKAKFDVDPDDERAAKGVLAILNQFESKIVPHWIDVRRVLDYLKIRSWSQCNKEIKFLDEEIDSESSKGEEREFMLQSSLMGFMCYCRVVIFDVVDCRSNNRSDFRCNGEVLSCLNPEDFRCPISLELMVDPVTISTGHTYDRSSILKWLKSGNFTCPKTGEKLTSTELIPNSTLRKLIQKFCSDNGIPIAEPGSRSRDITRTVLAGSNAAAEAMNQLARYLAPRLEVGTGEEKNKAAYEIRLLSKSSIFNRACFAEAGTIPPLLVLLSSIDPSIQENAIAALLNLSKYSKCKTEIVENGGLRLILDVLSRGLKMDCRQIAAATLFYLSSVEEYRILIGETPEAIPSLVNLIREGNPRGKKNAVVSIFGLLLYPGNHEMVIEAGIVPSLVDLLTSSEREDLVTDSLAVLARLAEKPDGTIVILGTSALPHLIRILNSSTSRVEKEYCVSLLLSLCNNGGAEAMSILQSTPSLMASLYSLLTDGTSRASKKASSLISILHEFHSSSSTGLLAPEVPQERFVHVR